MRYHGNILKRGEHNGSYRSICGTNAAKESEKSADRSETGRDDGEQKCH